MMIDGLAVRPVGYREAMELVTTRHYLRRKCSCTEAFGLYFHDELAGVAVFGKPASYTLCNGLAGHDESRNVVEFNRLWVSDDMPRNTESWFVSRALKLCRHELIVSFADTEQGHVGYIYQATNWLYCGESKRQRYFRPKGASTNSGGTEYRRRERMSRAAIVAQFGEGHVEEYFSSRKYRYVYINAAGKRRQELARKLRYPVLPYPKN